MKFYVWKSRQVQKNHFIQRRPLKKFRIIKTLPNSRINMTPPTIMQNTSITMAVVLCSKKYQDKCRQYWQVIFLGGFSVDMIQQLLQYKSLIEDHQLTKTLLNPWLYLILTCWKFRYFVFLRLCKTHSDTFIVVKFLTFIEDKHK